MDLGLNINKYHEEKKGNMHCGKVSNKLHYISCEELMKITIQEAVAHRNVNSVTAMMVDSTHCVA